MSTGFIKADRTKHISPHIFGFTQDLIDQKQLSIVKIESENNIADMLTKALPAYKQRQSRTPDRARTPIRCQTPDREATPDRGKSHAHQASPSFPPDCQMLELLPTPPSKTASIRDPRTASGGQHSEQHAGSDLAPIPSIRRSAVSGTLGSRTPRVEETCDSEDEIAPSLNMRQALTRLQNKASPGISSLVSGLDSHWKERMTPKKPRPS
jgi:hypothetical protein